MKQKNRNSNSQINLGIIGCGKIAKGLIKLCIRERIKPIVLIRNKEKINDLNTEFLSYQDRKFPGFSPISTEFTVDKKFLTSCNLIIESITEDFNKKITLYKSLKDVINKDSIIATTTSSLSIDSLAKVSGLETQYIGLHFFNPPHAIRFLEIIPAKKFDNKLMQRVILFISSIHYEYVTLTNMSGFIANRLLFTQILAAAELVVDQGLDEKTIDGIVKKSLKHPMGPFELIDLIGLSTVNVIINNIFTDAQKIKLWRRYYKKKNEAQHEEK